MIVSCRQMAFVLLVKNTKPGILMSVMHVIYNAYRLVIKYLLNVPKIKEEREVN